jgi:hypothetical protein
MIARKVFNVVLLSLLSSQVAFACVNNPDFTWGSVTDDGNPQKNCKQIRNKEERRVDMCPIPEVNAACPQTCGLCCEDDSIFRFKLKKMHQWRIAIGSQRTRKIKCTGSTLTVLKTTSREVYIPGAAVL